MSGGITPLLHTPPIVHRETMRLSYILSALDLETYSIIIRLHLSRSDIRQNTFYVTDTEANRTY